MSSKQVLHNGERSSVARFSTNEVITIRRRFLQVLQLGYPHYYPEVPYSPLALRDAGLYWSIPASTFTQEQLSQLYRHAHLTMWGVQVDMASHPRGLSIA
jgi:hypothetical protein